MRGMASFLLWFWESIRKGLHGGRQIRQSCFDVILIVSACFVLYFWDLGHAPFFDKQEPREALVVWEINHSGNWILPLRNGNEIPSKPPLYHWLAALVSRSADKIDEFTIR